MPKSNHGLRDHQRNIINRVDTCINSACRSLYFFHFYFYDREAFWQISGGIRTLWAVLSLVRYPPFAVTT